MRKSLLVALVLVLGASNGICAPAAAHMLPIRKACVLTRNCGRCPQGQWDCNGKCIPKGHACRLIS